jgi:hypothetical protein
MYTENLVNLFGGNGENTKPKKSNNTIIIVVVVIIIVFFFMFVFCNNFITNTTQKRTQEVIQKTTQQATQEATQEVTQEQIQKTTQEATQEATQEQPQEAIQKTTQEVIQENKLDLSNNEICSKYTDDVSGVPVECYEKLWKDYGCTEDLKKLFELSKGELPNLGEFKKGFESIKTNAMAKEMCYGPEKIDQSSKCAQYNNESTNISDDCLNELYFKNCPIFNVTNYKNTATEDEKNYTFMQHKMISESLPSMPKDMYNLLCQKPDASSKCAQYNNESTNISDECITEIFSKDCPGFDLNSFKNFDTNGTDKIKYQNLKSMSSYFKESPITLSKEICYGKDETKWPEPCSYFKDESNWIVEECVNDIWSKSGCTKEQPVYEYNKTLKEIKDDINNISASNDSRCN